MAKPALGRGLSALLGGKPSGGFGASASPTSSASVAGAAPVASAGVDSPGVLAGGQVSSASGNPAPVDAVERVLVGRVRASALQPRRVFPQETLQELADSIREQGILQPLVVRKRGEEFELVAGERRWRAAQLAGLAHVPVIVREADDATVLEWMLVENLQREGLNPIDEAQGYAELMEKFQLTQDSVATKVGRSRAAVANALRLLRLAPVVTGFLREGRLSAGHAKVILGLSDPILQGEAAQQVVKEGLSVRQSEELVARLSAAPTPAASTGERAPAAVTVRDPHIAAVEDKLRQRLGTRVTVRYKHGRGQIDIRFFSDLELERFLEIVGVEVE